MWSAHAWNDVPSGAVYSLYNTRKAGTGTDNNAQPSHKGFDAARCSSLYGKSVHVTPLSRKVRFMIRF